MSDPTTHVQTFGLAPTKTRCRLLTAVGEEGRVVRVYIPAGRDHVGRATAPRDIDVDTTTGATVTARMAELEQARWVRLREEQSTSEQGHPCRVWELTAAGAGVRDGTAVLTGGRAVPLAVDQKMRAALVGAAAHSRGWLPGGTPNRVRDALYAAGLARRDTAGVPEITDAGRAWVATQLGGDGSHV